MEPDSKDAFRPVDERTLLEVGSDSQSHHNPEAAIPPGARRFGQVAVLAELGAGGMGKVFKGRHLGLDVPVAVKVMGPQIAGDPHARQRFLREARTAARLDHPNVIRVLDVAEQDGVPYIVMEFVDGTDLAALLKKHGPLNGMAALRAVAQVADGLAHAHALGIVHRDIKPHNMFAARDGRVKLGDFGLARAVEQTTELTMPGAAIGTAHYMSPEQSQGRDVDQRSDVYSLGIAAYHLLAGVPPYSGTTPVSIAVQHVNSDVPYEREKFGHLPDAAVYLLISMTARDPARRPTAREVHDRLCQLLGQATGNASSRLASLDELVPQGSASQYIPFTPAGTPAPPPFPLSTPGLPAAPPQTFVPPPPQQSFAPPPQWQPQPMHSFQAGPGPAPQPHKGSNMLLWVALAVTGLLVLLAIIGFAAAGA
ncbi:MAG: serine/threonine protein kinase [Planctomycetes bacterium]|nr:serine/threonine protein kinase [Planctomycetota bacterium]